MPCSLFVSTESYYLISNQTTFFTRYQALYWKSRKKNSDSISLSEWSVRCRKLATQTINRIRTRMNTSYLDNCPRSLSKCHRQVQKKSNQSFDLNFLISFRMIRLVQKTYFTNYQQNMNKNAYQLFGQLSTKFIQMPQTSTKKAINLLNSIFKWTLSLTSHGQLYLLRCWFVPL